MHLWMDVMREIEPLLDNYPRWFDAWEAGGVDGLVIGPLSFDAPALLPGVRVAPGARPASATFDPDPAIYRRLGVEPPEPPADPQPEKRARLERVLVAAKERGWSVWLFQAGAGAGPSDAQHWLDAGARAALCARTLDTLAHYPMVDGAIMDGPELGYELAPHHMRRRSFIFDDLSPALEPHCAALGYDYARLLAAQERLWTRLHNLEPRAVALHAGGGLLGMFQLLGADADLMAWLAFRVDVLTDYFHQIRTCLASEAPSPTSLGVGPRTAAFAPLCGYDLARLAGFMDVLLPKLYVWQRGFDGLLGTVGRYVETLTLWNPGLSDADALAVVAGLFGLALPGVQGRDDLEEALAPEFYQQVAGAETRRALAAVGDPQRVVPWVDAGRFPHDGDPLSAAELKRLLEAAQAVGLQRFLYHHAGNLTAGEWAVMSALCGTPWRPLASDYLPPDRLVL